MKEVISFIGEFIGVFTVLTIGVCFMVFILNYAFPYISSLSPERRLEKFIDEECLKGNKVAIMIRQNKSYISDKDHLLIRQAIEGNENALKALKLDEESRKKYPY